MMEKLIQWDKDLMVTLNGFHSEFFDPIMLYVTQTYVWVPMYIFLLFLMLKDFKNDTWAPALGILIAIVLADQITSGLMKPFFQRLRPSHDPTLEGLIHIVNGYKGGKFGFASSHAANTFAAATYFWLLFKEKRKWIVVLFLWASVMTYSRIYLGVHFPGDIIVGMLIGILVAIFGFMVSKKILDYSYKRKSTQPH